MHLQGRGSIGALGYSGVRLQGCAGAFMGCPGSCREAAQPAAVQYLPSRCIRRSIEARAEMPVHSLFAVASAVIALVLRVHATSLLMAESARARAAVGRSHLRGLLHLGNGISEPRRVCGVEGARPISVSLLARL